MAAVADLAEPSPAGALPQRATANDAAHSTGDAESAAGEVLVS